MTVEQILKLAEIGYTKAEIEAMESPELPAEKPEEKAVIPEEKQTVTESETASKLDDIMASIRDTLKSIQAANVRGSSMPEVEPDTVDKALAAIITPSKRK